MAIKSKGLDQIARIQPLTLRRMISENIRADRWWSHQSCSLSSHSYCSHFTAIREKARTQGNWPVIHFPKAQLAFDIIVRIDDDGFMRYPGGKAKVFQQIVNLLPRHTVYIEPFLGAGSVLRAKARANVEIGIDKDPKLLTDSEFQSRGVQLVHGDGIDFLAGYPFEGHEVVYCDPPYLPETRRRQKVYKHDASDQDHKRLLTVVKEVCAHVLISGYQSRLYEQELASWNVHTFLAKTHDGVCQETLWYNFPRPTVLHDFRYLGVNYRERQTIKRRLERLKRRIEKLTLQEQSYVSQWLMEKTTANAD